MRFILMCGMAVAVLSATGLRADDFAYMAVHTGGFGTVDLNTGVFSSLGNSGQTLAGLGVYDGTLYGSSFDQSTGTLYKVNTSNGDVTPVGTAQPESYGDFGSTTAGLFAISAGADLYSIDPSTGTATEVGPLGVGIGNTIGLSDNSSTLYFTDGADLYTIDTTTGAATLVGGTGVTGIGALVFEDGTLYGGESQPTLEVETLDTGTGAATEEAALTGTSNTFYGLSPDPLPPAPEPATWLMLVTGGAALWLRQRTRRQS